MIVFRDCDRIEYVELHPSKCCHYSILRLLSSRIFGEIRRSLICTGCTWEDVQAAKTVKDALTSLNILTEKCMNSAALIEVVENMCRVVEEAKLLLDRFLLQNEGPRT